MEWFTPRWAWSIAGLAAVLCWPKAFDRWVHSSDYLDPVFAVWSLVLLPPFLAVVMLAYIYERD